MNERPIYMISVAADLVGMHPQTLRLYENKGLVRPQRTPGKRRRRFRRISRRRFEKSDRL